MIMPELVKNDRTHAFSADKKVAPLKFAKYFQELLQKSGNLGC